MQLLANTLPYIQVTLSVLLVIVILFQQTGAGLGGAFGGSDSSGFHTRRGAEKILFYATIIIAILFAVSAFLALII